MRHTYTHTRKLLRTNLNEIIIRSRSTFTKYQIALNEPKRILHYRAYFEHRNVDDYDHSTVCMLNMFYYFLFIQRGTSHNNFQSYRRVHDLKTGGTNVHGLFI